MRDRALVLAGIVGITVAAWLYVVLVAGRDILAMPRDMVMPFQPWTATDFLLMLLMWTAMMAGMMLPSAAPTLLVFSYFARRQRAAGHPVASTGIFALGYAIAWTVFSLAATFLQWALESAALMSPMMVATSRFLGGGLLVAAGLYQWSPPKRSCLAHCRSPLDFVARHFRADAAGALRMGIEHGIYCVGCCWLLMSLLFFAGVMNLEWVAAIMLLVLLEKIVPFGPELGRASGVLLAAAGLLVLYGL
ncbi:MAG TPA: DUF2182 domain-containing protein [Alphaproteobacteria bacterium]|nr:DUF2182 domain-containing protein [Alphaproteobacteria bacterium]